MPSLDAPDNAAKALQYAVKPSVVCTVASPQGPEQQKADNVAQTPERFMGMRQGR